jgi:probable rRNA maturation factor
MSGLTLLNRQKSRPLDLRLFRRIAEALLAERLGARPFEIGVHIVAARAIAALNWEHLRHEGSTDVITFAHTDPDGDEPLMGDIFICLDEAILQAKQFRTSWQSEITRYLVHGVLHLQGWDDLEPAARRRMKSVENRLLKKLAQEFPLPALHRKDSRPTGVRKRK